MSHFVPQLHGITHLHSYSHSHSVSLTLTHIHPHTLSLSQSHSSPYSYSYMYINIHTYTPFTLTFTSTFTLHVLPLINCTIFTFTGYSNNQVFSGIANLAISRSPQSLFPLICKIWILNATIRLIIINMIWSSHYVTLFKSWNIILVSQHIPRTEICWILPSVRRELRNMIGGRAASRPLCQSPVNVIPLINMLKTVDHCSPASWENHSIPW